MEAVQLQPWEKNYCADLHVKVKTRTRIKASDDPSSCDLYGLGNKKAVAVKLVWITE